MDTLEQAISHAETVQAPARPDQTRKLVPFTSETARAAAIKRGAMNRAKRLALEAEQAMAMLAWKQARAAVAPGLEGRIGKLELLITQAEAGFAKTSDPREMSSLANALDKLYQTWALLTGHEKPGTRKAAKSRSTPGLTLPVPTSDPS